MLETGDLELAVGYLKCIFESCRCPICDTSTGGRLRYDCGHVACPDCAEVAPACQLCTPPRGSEALLHDERLTQRVLHVGELLKSFQEAYNIDVLKSKRISDQLKLERSLFPQCIQAPQTYCNKRKSFPTPKKSKGKENISILPGELISAAVIMDNSANFVQKWLDQHDNDFKTYQPRKPFADLSTNSPNIKTPTKKQSLTNKENLQTPSKSAKKRPFKTALSATKSQSIFDKYLKESKKNNIPEQAKRIKKELAKFQEEDKARNYFVNSTKNNEKDESGIELDDDAIVIEDSEEFVDKDKAAWLAVLEAEKIKCTPKSKTKTVDKPQIKYHERVSIFSPKVLNWMNSDTNDFQTTFVKKPCKVPFYKKAPITEPCKLCYNTQLDNYNTAASIEDKNISIIVETSKIITTITVNKSIINTPKYVEPSSKATQTDLNKENSQAKKQKTIKLLESEDMFTMENKDLAKINNETLNLPEADKVESIVDTKYCMGNKIELTNKESSTIHKQKKHNPELSTEILNPGKNTSTAAKFKDIEKRKSVVLLDSSDSEHELSGKITVTADVHRSHEDSDVQGILREISLSEIRVPKALKRGITPTSTDSSDKENRDPNTKRKRRDGKKSRKKP